MVNKIPILFNDLSHDVELNRLAPERGLFAAVLFRAYVDLDINTAESRQHVHSAIRWFRSTDKSRKIITYSWCIEVLDLSHAQLVWLEEAVSTAEGFVGAYKNAKDIPAPDRPYKRRRRGRFGIR